jgi:hypothetical protein
VRDELARGDAKSALRRHSLVDVQNEPTCERLLGHASALTMVPAAQEADAWATSRLLSQARLYYDKRAAYAEAESLLRRALDILETSDDAEHARVVGVRQNFQALIARVSGL